MDAATQIQAEQYTQRHAIKASLLAATVALCTLAGINTGAAEAAQVVIRDLSVEPESVREAERLYTRIHRAARNVCGDRSGLRLVERITVRECVKDTVARTVEDVDNGLLTALHTRSTERVAAGRAVATMAEGRSQSHQ